MGVFVDGDTPEGVSDLVGNAVIWTSSLWGMDIHEPEYTYPYDRADGREEAEAPPGVLRVVRGSSWSYGLVFSRAASRSRLHPVSRYNMLGFRLARGVPVP